MWKDFVFQITVFGMLATMILNMLPRDVYKKYVRLSLGFLLLLLMLKPITGGFHIEDTIDTIFSDFYKELSNMENSASYQEAEQEYQRLLKELYEENIAGMEEYDENREAD